jgi:phospholipase D3/4
LQKIFTVYWRLGEDQKIPTRWPLNLGTKFNAESPLAIEYDGLPAGTFVSSSPEEFNPKGREHDLDAIVKLMANATRYVRIAVMDYMPTTLYMPHGENYYWPPLDDAIRSAAYRGVRVELLISHWNHSRPEMTTFLRSLLQLNSAFETVQPRIAVKIFTVPSDGTIPFARVNHNKYFVTDKAAYVGTSNWAGDYFITTAGVGFVVMDSPRIVGRFNDVFLRDWNSNYATQLNI